MNFMIYFPSAHHSISDIDRLALLWSILVHHFHFQVVVNPQYPMLAQGQIGKPFFFPFMVYTTIVKLIVDFSAQILISFKKTKNQTKGHFEVFCP
jgi:hypothetical protein